MPPSPYKRNRRMKSRLMAGSDEDRANLRTKAVEMMRRGVARQVDKESGPIAHAYVPGREGRPHPQAKPRTGDVVRGTKVPTGPNGRPISSGHVPVRPAAPRPHPRGGDIILKRPDRPAPQTTLQRPDHPAPRTTTGPKANTPLPRPRLKPESGGTGNHAAPRRPPNVPTPRAAGGIQYAPRDPVAKRPASAYDNQLSSLARQRALSENRNNRGTRALMSVATRDTDTGGAAWRQSRAYRMGRSIRRRRARRWLRNTAQGPSRPQYS